MVELDFKIVSDDPPTKIPRYWYWTATDHYTQWRIDYGVFSPEGDDGFTIEWRFLPVYGDPSEWTMVNRSGKPGSFDVFPSKAAAIKGIEEISG